MLLPLHLCNITYFPVLYFKTEDFTFERGCDSLEKEGCSNSWILSFSCFSKGAFPKILFSVSSLAVLLIQLQFIGKYDPKSNPKMVANLFSAPTQRMRREKPMRVITQTSKHFLFHADCVYPSGLGAAERVLSLLIFCIQIPQTSALWQNCSI